MLCPAAPAGSFFPLIGILIPVLIFPFVLIPHLVFVLPPVIIDPAVFIRFILIIFIPEFLAVILVIFIILIAIAVFILVGLVLILLILVFAFGGYLLSLLCGRPASAASWLLRSIAVPASSFALLVHYNHQKDDQEHHCNGNGYCQKDPKQVKVLTYLVILYCQCIVLIRGHHAACCGILKVSLDGPLTVLHIIAVEVLFTSLIHTIHNTVLRLLISAPYPALYLVAVNIDGAGLKSVRNLNRLVRRKYGNGPPGYLHLDLFSCIRGSSAGTALRLGHHDHIFLGCLPILGRDLTGHPVLSHLEAFIAGNHLVCIIIRCVRADDQLIHVRAHGHRIGIHIRRECRTQFTRRNLQAL